MDRRILAALLFASAGCSTPQGATTGGSADAVPLRERLVNRSPLNVVTCQVTPVAPALSNEDTVVGALISARPLVEECLVDPKHRTQEKETTVVLAATVDETGATYDVTGTNATPEGLACAKAAVEKAVKLPAVDKGAQPVKGQVSVVHVKDESPTVTFGVNELSDVVGHVRLAQAGWCDCYAGFKDRAPPSVRAWAHLLKGTNSLSDIHWVQPGAARPEQPLKAAQGSGAEQATVPSIPADFSPAQRQLAECLQGKLQTLQFPASATREWQLPYAFDFFNSSVATPADNAAPDLAFRQLSEVRQGEQAQTAIAYGEWKGSADRFAELATRYNNRDKKVTYKQVKEQCLVRAKASEALVAQMDEQISLEKRMQEFTEGLAAKDPAWTEAATRVGQEATKTQGERAELVKVRDEDTARCKKL